MIGDEWNGGVTWGVLWGEVGQRPVSREYGDEDEARAMHAHLTRRYEEQGRTDRPELIMSRLTWVVVE
ncbi:hypothetical protein MHPYR_180077 [uncultured Mycobacterium sp.]|uniref:Uncharacterized protein n=1 Tax=uncultured Mycobacterium sp. TaxID=171292 RepID=A0A1Y5P575_9MYCO|nr:hypothetical protein MHPYR_180077 [uncultured Mycobacterium sp.]